MTLNYPNYFSAYLSQISRMTLNPCRLAHDTKLRYLALAFFGEVVTLVCLLYVTFLYEVF